MRSNVGVLLEPLGELRGALGDELVQQTPGGFKTNGFRCVW